MSLFGGLVGGLIGNKNVQAIKAQQLMQEQEDRLAANDAITRERALYDLGLAQKREGTILAGDEADLTAKQAAAKDALFKLKQLKVQLEDENNNRGFNQVLDRMTRGGNVLKLQAEIANQQSQAAENKSQANYYQSEADLNNLLFGPTGATDALEKGVLAPEALIQQRNKQVADHLTESLWSGIGQPGTPPGSVYDLIGRDFSRAMSRADSLGRPLDDDTRRVVANALIQKYQPQIKALLEPDQQAAAPGAQPAIPSKITSVGDAFDFVKGKQAAAAASAQAQLLQTKDTMIQSLTQAAAQNPDAVVGVLQSRGITSMQDLQALEPAQIKELLDTIAQQPLLQKWSDLEARFPPRSRMF